MVHITTRHGSLQQLQKTQFLKNIQIAYMKIREARSPRLQKCNKRTSEADPDFRQKIAVGRSEEEYLSPMHIKLPKGKPKSKKEVKFSKTAGQFDEKTTKRREKKKHTQQCNGSSANENAELIATIKYDKALPKPKAKPTEKTLRNSSKNNAQEKCLLTDEVISTKIHSKISQKKHNSSKLDIQLPQEEYLFIGDQFFPINNYLPTKRLLNTFREVCGQDNLESKFIMQDRGDKVGRQRLEFRRDNIFVAARKEIEMKNRLKKVVKLQRWWRRMIQRHGFGEEKSNPEIVVNVSPIKYNFDSFDQINAITPIKPYLQDLRKDGFDEVVTPKRGSDDIDIVSFNSADMMDQKPKKIQFKQEDLSKMLMGSYKLPQNEVDHHQNQEIFSSYTRFRINQADINNYSESQDSSENLLSPKKDDVYPKEIVHENLFEAERQNGFDLLREFQEATRIKELIDQRITMQKGQIKQQQKSTKIGISTSILSIHTMLVNFFHFYINKHRDEFLSLVNMPFGHSIESRLRALRGLPLPEEIEEDQSGIFYGLQNIIDDEKLEEYWKFIEGRDNRMCSSFSKANFQLEKIHFKAVVDYFNRQINQYRPYKQINGIPYPWNHSYKALTFYFVSQDNIPEVFEKTELKVLKAASLMCGIIVPELEDKDNDGKGLVNVDNFMEVYQNSNNGLILQHNDGREVKLIHQEVKGEAFEYDCQLFSGLLLEIANEVVSELMLEAALLLSHQVRQPPIY